MDNSANRFREVLVCWAAMLITAISNSGCSVVREAPAPAAPTINIGVIASTEGPLWLYGRECIKGLELAIDECNSAGGVKGRTISLKINNNEGDPTRSADAVRQFAADSTVLAVIGPVTSNNFLAAAESAQLAKIPILSPYSTNPLVTEIGAYVSRICFTDVAQGRALARYAYHSLRLKNIAVLSENNNSYSEGLARFFEREFNEIGGNICATASYDAADKTYLPYLQSIFLRAPDAIFLPGYFPQAKQLLCDVVTMKSSATFLGGDGWESLERLELPAEVLSDRFPIFITSHFSLEEMQISAQHFVEQYESRFNYPPNTLSALAYDAAGVVIEALKRASRLDRDALMETINSTREYPGATGTITLNEKRDALKRVYIQEFRGGKFHLRAFNVPTP